MAPSQLPAGPLVTHLGSVGAWRAGEPAGTLQPLCAGGATLTGEAAFALAWGGGDSVRKRPRGHGEGRGVLGKDVRRAEHPSWRGLGCTGRTGDELQWRLSQRVWRSLGWGRTDSARSPPSPPQTPPWDRERRPVPNPGAILTLGPTRPGAPASPGTPCGDGGRAGGQHWGGQGALSPRVQPGGDGEEGGRGPHLVSGFAALSGGTWWPGQPLGGQAAVLGGVPTSITPTPAP